MSQDGKSTPSVASVVGVVALLITGMFVLFNGAQRFNTRVVQNHLKAFSEYVNIEAGKYGSQASFTYGDITLNGWGYDKRATIRDVRLEISSPHNPNAVRWILATDSIIFRPDKMSAARLLADFNEPLHIARNGQPLYALSLSSALTYSHFDGIYKGEHVIQEDITLPERMVFKAMSAPVDAQDSRSDISYAPNAEISLTRRPGSNKTDMSFILRDLKLAQPDGNIFTVGTLTSYFTLRPDDHSQLAGQFTITALDFAFIRPGRESKSYSFNLDIGYSADKDAASHFSLNKCILLNDEFKLKATGGFITSRDDLLPYGNVMLELINPDRFLASELIPAHSQLALTEMLEKIGNTSAEGKNMLSIPLSREKNQIAYIGKYPFEEVASALLTGLPQASPAITPPVTKD